MKVIELTRFLALDDIKYMYGVLDNKWGTYPIRSQLLQSPHTLASVSNTQCSFFIRAWIHIVFTGSLGVGSSGTVGILWSFEILFWPPPRW